MTWKIDAVVSELIADALFNFQIRQDFYFFFVILHVLMMFEGGGLFGNARRARQILQSAMPALLNSPWFTALLNIA